MKIKIGLALLMAATLAGCAGTNTTTVVYVTPAPSVAPQSTGQLLPPAIRTASPTSVPEITPKPTSAPVTDPAWMEFVNHESSFTNDIFVGDYRAFQDCLDAWGNSDFATCSVNEGLAAAKQVSTDAAQNIAWLKANPPDACYSKVYNNTLTAYTEIGKAMSALIKYVTGGGHSADLNSVTSHLQNGTDALNAATDGMNAANTACGG